MINIKLSYLLLFSLIINIVLIYPQDLQLIGPPGGIVRFGQLGIQKNSPQNVYAAGYYGSLFNSSDRGRSVVPIETYFKDYSITTIFPYPSDDSEMFLGLFHYPLRTTNSGQSWEILNQNNSSRNHFAFNNLNEEVIYMNRNTKEIWRSDNGGDSWYYIYTFNDKITSLSASPSDTSVLYCGADNYLYKSTDSGWSWEQLPNIFGIIWKIKVNPFNAASVYFKNGGLLTKSMNDGMEVRDLLAGDVGDFELSNSDTNIIYATQYGLLKTTDEGNSWFSIVNEGLPNVSIGSDAIALNPQDDKELYAGINALGVYKTTNGGEKWNRTNLSYSDVYTIYVDPDTAGHIITGQYGWGSMYTYDDGKKWIHPGMGNNFQDLSLKYFSFNPENNNEGLVAAYYGIYKTTDRGRNWFELNSVEPVTSVSYHPVISNTIFISLEYGSLLKSDDGGISWYQVLSGKTVYEYAYHPANPDIIYIISGADVLKSMDEGETWQTINNGIASSLTPFTSLAISPINSELLYCGRRAIGQEKGSLYMTTNGGDNWFRIDTTLRTIDNWVSVSSIWLDPDVAERFYVGLLDHGDPLISEAFSNGKLLLTEDNGKNWRRVFDSEVNVIKADNSNPRNIYIGTKFGVMKFIDTLTVTNIDEIKGEALDKYSLLQNYPNPFNPSTKIEFAIPVQSEVQLTIYNILGQKITSLYSGELQAGAHSFTWNADDSKGNKLSSGIYFYELKAKGGNGNDFQNTKKMLLLK
jgi:photosystem II stability/assembly factor-like uncharacterized protein